MKFKNALVMPVWFVVLLLVASQRATGQPSSRSGTCGGKTVVVDLRAAAIAGVAIDRPVAEVRNEIGGRRVREVTEQLEGHDSIAWEMDFCGHKATRHWNGIEWTDDAFRTVDGLGVGSRLSEFNRRYGPGKFFESESTGFQYGADGSLFSVATTEQCYIDFNAGRGVKDPRCKVRSIFVVLRPEVP